MSGSLRLVPGDPGTGIGTADRRLPTGQPDPAHSGGKGVVLRRSAPRPLPQVGDPLDELAEELVDVCGPAVHPDEIAAVLESCGLTDEQITTRYARRDLFEVAEELYARVSRRFPEPEPEPDPWQTNPWRCLLRGAVFGLPGLAYTLGAGLLSGQVTGLAASALVAWAWNQGLAHRAYLRLGTGGRPAAGRCLLRGALTGAVAATAAALLTSGTGTVVAFAAGQALYLAAATVLLVFGGEWDLLLAFTPTASGAASLLVWDPGPVAVAGLLLGTVATAALLAAREIIRSLRADAPRVGVPPPVASVPYGLFGLAAGVLTFMAAAAGGPAVVVVLTLSMGAAEWLLYRYRSLTLAALRHSRTPTGFRLRVSRALALCLTGYLAMLVPPALATGLPLWLLLALGAVLWTALLLQAFGIAWLSAVVCLAAAGAEAAGAEGAFPTAGLSPMTVQPMVCFCAAVALLTAACTKLGRLTAHR